MVIWDILGQKYHEELHKGHYSGTDAALFVFDLTRKDTFEKLESWINSLYNSVGKVPAVLLGNKADLQDWEVSEEELKKFAEKFAMPHFLTSAKTGMNVENAFKKVGEMLLRR